jgi:hypothetical protein
MRRTLNEDSSSSEAGQTDMPVTSNQPTTSKSKVDLTTKESSKKK